MTVGAYAKKSYSGNDSTTTFAVDWAFFTDAQIVVKLITDSDGSVTSWTDGVDYTIENRAGSSPYTGAEVEATVAPATGETLLIYRETTQTQTLALQASGTFASDSVNNRFDLHMMLMQELDDKIDNHCIRIPIADGDGITVQLPNSVDRASETPSFDASGNVTTS